MRDDGKDFHLRQPALAKGQSVMLAIGDGAAGKASYKGSISAPVGSQQWSDQLSFDTLVRAPIKMGYDPEHLDLDKRVLQFRMSRLAGSAELMAIGEDGKELGTGTATYKKEPPDTWLPISWTQPPGTRVMMLKLRVVSAEGLSATLELVPWSVEIAHEDVKLRDRQRGDRARRGGQARREPRQDQRGGEARREVHEDAALRRRPHRHRRARRQEPEARSTARARSRRTTARRGLALPIAFAGYGEDVPKVKTADNVDERANRRADYVLGPAGGAPPFRGPYLKARAAWQQLP